VQALVWGLGPRQDAILIQDGSPRTLVGPGSTDIPVCPCGTGTTACQNERFFIHHFSILILHLKPFAIASAHRLESGLVRLMGRGTSALSKRRVENFLDDVKMTNEKWKIYLLLVTSWSLNRKADRQECLSYPSNSNRPTVTRRVLLRRLSIRQSP
jgi:hypothetical protein